MQFIRLNITLLFIMFSVLAHAQTPDEPASEASVKELMEISQVRNVLDSMKTQMGTMIKLSMQQSLSGRKFTPEQEQIISDTQSKLLDLYSEDMKWENMEPVFIDIYHTSFTQSEVDGMITFYKSDAGKATLNKLPLVMQKSMQIMQLRAKALMPKIQEIQSNAIAQMKETMKK